MQARSPLPRGPPEEQDPAPPPQDRCKQGAQGEGDEEGGMEMTGDWGGEGRCYTPC